MINIGDYVKVKSSFSHNFKEDQIVRIDWSDINNSDFFKCKAEDGHVQFLTIDDIKEVVKDDIKEVVKDEEKKVYHREEIINTVEDLLKYELEKLSRLDNISNEILIEMFLCSFVDQIKKQF